MPGFSSQSNAQFLQGLELHNQDVNAFYTTTIEEDNRIQSLQGNEKRNALTQEKCAFLALCMVNAVPADFFAGGVVNNTFNWNPTNNEMVGEIGQSFNTDQVEDFTEQQLLMFNTYLNTLEGDEKQALDDVLEYMSPEDMWKQRKVIANALLGERLIPAPNKQQVPVVNQDNQVVAVEKVINQGSYEQAHMVMMDYKGKLDSFIENAKEGKPLEFQMDESIIYNEENEYDNEPLQLEDVTYYAPSGNYHITRRQSLQKADMVIEFGNPMIPIQDKRNYLLSVLFINATPEEFKALCEQIQSNENTQKAVDEVANYATTDDLTNPEIAKNLREHISSYAASPSPLNLLNKDIERLKANADKVQKEFDEIDKELKESIKQNDNEDKEHEKEKDEDEDELQIIQIEEAPEINSDYIDRVSFKENEDPKTVLMSKLRNPNSTEKEKVSYLVAYFFNGAKDEEYFQALQNLAEDSKIKVEDNVNQIQNHRYCNLVGSILALSDKEGFENFFLNNETKQLMQQCLSSNEADSLNIMQRMARRVGIFKENLKKAEDKKNLESSEEELIIRNDDPKQENEIKINLNDNDKDNDLLTQQEKEIKINLNDNDKENDLITQDDEIMNHEVIIHARSKNITLYDSELGRFNTSRLGIFKNESEKHIAVRKAAERMIKFREQAEKGQNGKMSVLFEKLDERQRTIQAANYLSAAKELNYRANVYVESRNPLTFAGADRYGGAKSLAKFSNTDTNNALAIIKKYKLDLSKIQKAIAESKLTKEAENLNTLDRNKIASGDKEEIKKFREVLLSSLAANVAIENLSKGADPMLNDYYAFRKDFDKNPALNRAIIGYMADGEERWNAEEALKNGAKSFIRKLKDYEPSLNFDILKAPKKPEQPQKGKVVDNKNNSMKI